MGPPTPPTHPEGSERLSNPQPGIEAKLFGYELFLRALFGEHQTWAPKSPLHHVAVGQKQYVPKTEPWLVGFTRTATCVFSGVLILTHHTHVLGIAPKTLRTHPFGRGSLQL